MPGQSSDRWTHLTMTPLVNTMLSRSDRGKYGSHLGRPYSVVLVSMTTALTLAAGAAGGGRQGRQSAVPWLRHMTCVAGQARARRAPEQGHTRPAHARPQPASGDQKGRAGTQQQPQAHTWGCACLLSPTPSPPPPPLSVGRLPFPPHPTPIPTPPASPERSMSQKSTTVWGSGPCVAM
jgi:hypothetical protein